MWQQAQGLVNMSCKLQKTHATISVQGNVAAGLDSQYLVLEPHNHQRRFSN
jgi:hypothetical protein